MLGGSEADEPVCSVNNKTKIKGSHLEYKHVSMVSMGAVPRYICCATKMASQQVSAAIQASPASPGRISSHQQVQPFNVIRYHPTLFIAERLQERRKIGRVAQME